MWVSPALYDGTTCRLYTHVTLTLNVQLNTVQLLTCLDQESCFTQTHGHILQRTVALARRCVNKKFSKQNFNFLKIHSQLFFISKCFLTSKKDFYLRKTKPYTCICQWKILAQMSVFWSIKFSLKMIIE